MIRNMTLGDSLRLRALLGIVACTFLLTLPAFPALAAGDATIEGSVLISDGSSPEGVQVFFKELATGKEYVAKVDAAGEYSFWVPPSGQYKLVKAIAPDGRLIPIQSSVPQSVRAPGVYTQSPLKINVPPAPGPVSNAPAVKPAKAPVAKALVATPRSSVGESHVKPWYRRPGPITAVVLGAVVVGAAAANNDDNSSSAFE